MLEAGLFCGSDKRYSVASGNVPGFLNVFLTEEIPIKINCINFSSIVLFTYLDQETATICYRVRPIVDLIILILTIYIVFIQKIYSKNIMRLLLTGISIPLIILYILKPASPIYIILKKVTNKRNTVYRVLL